MHGIVAMVACAHGCGIVAVGRGRRIVRTVDGGAFPAIQKTGRTGECAKVVFVYTVVSACRVDFVSGVLAYLTLFQ